MNWPWVLIAVVFGIGLALVLRGGDACYDTPTGPGSYCTTGLFSFGPWTLRAVSLGLVAGLLYSLWRALRRSSRRRPKGRTHANGS